MLLALPTSLIFEASCRSNDRMLNAIKDAKKRRGSKYAGNEKLALQALGEVFDHFQSLPEGEKLGEPTQVSMFFRSVSLGCIFTPLALCQRRCISS